MQITEAATAFCVCVSISSIMCMYLHAYGEADTASFLSDVEKPDYFVQRCARLSSDNNVRACNKSFEDDKRPSVRDLGYQDNRGKDSEEVREAVSLEEKSRFGVVLA